MGTSIFSWLEEFDGVKWNLIDGEPLELQNYDSFALLCGVRDYYRPVPIVPVNRGLPVDLSIGARVDLSEQAIEFLYGLTGYLTLQDIDSYDYWDTPFVDTRSGPNGEHRSGVPSYSEPRPDESKYGKQTPNEVLAHSDLAQAIKLLREHGGKLRIIFAFS